jgi:ribonuclease P protein component
MRRGEDFSRTTKTGHRVSSPSLTLYFLTHDQLPLSSRVGLIINKSVGGSVTRHRIARQLRHAMAAHLAALPPHTQVVVRVIKTQDDYRIELDEVVTKMVKRTGAKQ